MEYRELLTEAREGIPLNKESFYETEAAISDAVRKGQHIYHIIQSNNFPTSKTSIYRHINKGYYSISNIDLPRAVKFKPRRAKQSEFVPKWAKEGRTYADFLQFLEQNDSPEYAEMDSIYENRPWASQYDGQWRCRYLIQMPGLQEWPDSVGLTVKTGDLLRVRLSETR